MRRLRDFEQADQPKARALIQDGLRSRWGDAFDPTANPDTDDLWQHYISIGAEIVVVEADRDLVGIGILRPEPALTKPEAKFRLLRISVARSHQRQGIGRTVVEELIRRAKVRGAEEVVVSTDTPWSDAVALYKSCGFVATALDDEETHLNRPF